MKFYNYNRQGMLSTLTNLFMYLLLVIQMLFVSGGFSFGKTYKARVFTDSVEHTVVSDSPQNGYHTIESYCWEGAKINGISYVAPRGNPLKNDFVVQKEHNATYTAITPYSFYDPGKDLFVFDSGFQWNGEKTEGCIQSVKYAKASGLNVLLKPHVWVLKDGWCGELKFESQKSWDIFAKGYSEYMMHYARLADSMNVEMFCIGVEFRQTAVDHSDFFRALILQIRKEYKGKIVYASNWDYYHKIPFWNDVDMIGVDAYFPVCFKETPSCEMVKEGWMSVKEDLKAISEQMKKPVLFTEYGYRSISKCAGKQWELPNDWKYHGETNMKAQEASFEGLYMTFWDEPWFAGGFVWKWFTNHTSAGGPGNSGFTPQNKPAAEILRKYYAKYK